ncbi:nucleotide-binding universal stress UspA family protein [Rhodobium orientis]|uniref:Universal stress protein UspA n=1 Tax=Rhodobium orientis TaxID=34017 RepID=A0A327JGJ5_9HYPH|nr:universal stress protein [Rhodobium orientis]MBB4301485.1 nucleotide-binding universal stress UspA family protein [Rhodobium orientis]MBK5952182.1 universal stress protein UspA [Rhodobium orientis]RAI25449.1 universal stress protein UspA [Rhodobium orientis]
MFDKILLPIDLDEESSWQKALPVAELLAADYGAELNVLAVIPTFNMSVVGSYFPQGYEKQAMADAKEHLKKLLEAECKRDSVKVKGHVAHGTIYQEIIQVADDLGCDLIVISSHRPELKDYLLGPNAARVVRHAGQSVFVVRN